MKAMARSFNEDKDLISVFQGDIFMPYLFRLPRLCTLNIHRFNKRKGFHLKKKRQEANNIPQNVWQKQMTQITSHFSQIHQPKQNPYSITCTKQQEALSSLWMQTKQSACVSNKKGQTSKIGRPVYIPQ